MKLLLHFLLRLFSQSILKKYQPTIIAVTGSMGKTSTKEAIFTVLSQKFKTRRSIKNYNNEIGVPLTIIGTESGGRSLIKWISVFVLAFKLILWQEKNYPQVLILEMGADRPGDIQYLTRFIKPQIAVVTAVGPVHLEFFKTLENIVYEKSALLKNLTKDDWAILNADEEKVLKMKEATKAQVLTFGFSERAEVRMIDTTLSYNHLLCNTKIAPFYPSGITFKLGYKGNVVPIHLSGVIGQSLVRSALAAIAIGIIYDINLLEIGESLRRFNPPPGRMRLLPGIKETLIIDDTYNSSPLAAISALKTAASINPPAGGLKYVVLGDMLELGSYSEEGHESVGREVFESKIDVLITVGERAKDIARGAFQKGMKREQIFSFDKTKEAAKFLQTRIKSGDLILIKGSRGMRMETITKEIMAEPERASQLLVEYYG